MYERVTRKQSKGPRSYCSKIIDELHKELKPKYSFTSRIVGSAAYNTIIKDKEGYWDIDYQILLTENSKEYKENALSNPTNIKNDFFNYFNEKFKNNEGITVQNSTTAVTLINKHEKYSIDIVIIRLHPDYKEIIRRNNKKNSSTNEFTWNELPKYNDAYKIFKEMSAQEKNDVIEKVIERKKQEKQKDDSNPSKKPSFALFIEEVNNYVNKK